MLPFIEKDRVFYASRVGLGNDLPYGPGKEWAQWLYVWLSYKSPNLAPTRYNRISPRCAQLTPQAQKNTKELDKPYLFIGFEDDALCVK